MHFPSHVPTWAAIIAVVVTLIGAPFFWGEVRKWLGLDRL
jgi:hypothetical protein